MTLPSLDLTLFRWIDSQTSQDDRLALLSIQKVLSYKVDSYRYLEVGSHLGGSLQPHVIDERCKEIFSIDPRPLEQPDERLTTTFKYEGNSTQRMFDQLKVIPDANLGKIKTFEASSWDVPLEAISDCVDFAFIDGEHTNSAVLRDFQGVRRFLSAQSIMAFHDCFVTPSAILKIRKRLRDENADAHFLYYPNSQVIAIVFGFGHNIVNALIDSGWTQRLPISQWSSIKLSLKKTWLYSFIRG